MMTLLVDAHNLAYRAWFNRERREDPAAAAELLMKMLLAEAEAVSATRRIAAVERTRSFRFDLYPGYKAGRRERSAELKIFIEGVPELAQQAGYEVWHAPGHEADDVMATFAQQLLGDVRIVTTDRDLCGCVDARVQVLLPVEPGVERVILDEAHVRHTFGVAPAALPFYKALVGDPSDGIPGVKGLGKVKAAPLLRRFDSLSALYDGLATLDVSLQTLMIQTPRAEVELYQQITTLVSDAPLERLWPDGQIMPTPPEEVHPVTPAWGISLGPLETTAYRATPEDEILEFLQRFPPPPGTEADHWPERWEEVATELELAAANSLGWCLKVLADPNCPPEVLELLSRFEHAALNRMIAWHGRCPPALLFRYRTSNDNAIRVGGQRSPDRQPFPDLSQCSEAEARRLTSQWAGAEDDVDVYLARNPTTPVAVLCELAGSDEVAVRLALATGEHSARIVSSALQHDPQQVVRQALAANPATHPSTLESLVSDHIGVQIALAGNRALPDSTFTTLSKIVGDKSDSASIHRRLGFNPSFSEPWQLSSHYYERSRISPPELFWYAWNILHWDDLEPLDSVRSRLAYAAPGALPQLSRLVDDFNVSVRVRLAQNPACPASLLSRLSHDQSPRVRGAVAVHSACPDHVREQLKRDAHWHVRRIASQDFGATFTDRFNLDALTWYEAYLLASHPSCPPLILEALSGWDSREEWQVRMAVARHSACPVGVLRRLARDDAWTSRSAVASNPQTPLDVLEVLSRDVNPHVREWVATQGACSPETLTRLADDQQWQVRLAVAGHRDTPESVLIALGDDLHTHVRQAVAKNSKSPHALLVQLAKSDHFSVKNALARSEAVQDSVLLLLTKEAKWQNRYLVAMNPNSSVEILDKLIDDSDDDVRRGVASNRNVTSEQLRRLSKDNAVSVRLAVASNPRCPLDILSECSRDAHRDVREAVARNTEALNWAETTTKASLDLEFLNILALDPDNEVAFALQYQPQHRRPMQSVERFELEFDEDVAGWLYSNIDCPIDILEGGEISRFSWDDIIDRPDATPELIERLHKEGLPAIKVLNTAQPSIESIESLDWDVSVEASVAYIKNAGTPSQSWLIWSPELIPVFCRLLTTTDLSTEPLIFAGVHSDDWRIRQGAASNIKLPVRWLAQLGYDPHPDVRLAVAKNPSSPPGVLRLLLQESLRQDKGREEHCGALAMHPCLPVSSMHDLLGQSESVLCALAQNPALPAHLQLFLASDGRDAVRRTLQKHPGLSEEARARLSAF